MKPTILKLDTEEKDVENFHMQNEAQEQDN